MNSLYADERVTPPEDEELRIWPSAEYAEYVERLRRAVGQRIFLVEMEIGAIQLSAHLSDRAYELLGVVDFPRPDPVKRAYPHIILLDDGRGVNLGRVARISLNTPFAPPAEDVLFAERLFLERMLFAPQRFSQARIAAQSRRLLGEFLGKTEEQIRRLPGADDS
jgi:hypothetical protein